MAAAEKQNKKKEKKEAPAVVRVRSRGQVSQALERFAEMYRNNYPERDVRYVYDPTHKPELSGIMGRQALGYQIVTYGELGLVDEKEGVAEDQTVRVGDLVLMSVDKDTKQALRDEREELARDQMKKVNREFYHEVEEEARKRTPRDHSGPGSRPIGRAVIEERSFEYDIEQREE